MAGSAGTSSETSTSSVAAAAGAGRRAEPETSGAASTSHSAEVESHPPPVKTPSVRQQQAHKLADFLKANLENLDGLTSANKVGSKQSKLYSLYVINCQLLSTVYRRWNCQSLQ